MCTPVLWIDMCNLCPKKPPQLRCLMYWPVKNEHLPLLIVVLPLLHMGDKCDWLKAVNYGTSCIDPSEAVVYVIPLGVTRLRRVIHRVYHIHQGFLGVYPSLDHVAQSWCHLPTVYYSRLTPWTIDSWLCGIISLQTWPIYYIFSFYVDTRASSRFQRCSHESRQYMI